jgi:hypothetical protein
MSVNCPGLKGQIVSAHETESRPSPTIKSNLGVMSSRVGRAVGTFGN